MTPNDANEQETAQDAAEDSQEDVPDDAISPTPHDLSRQEAGKASDEQDPVETVESGHELPSHARPSTNFQCARLTKIERTLINTILLGQVTSTPTLGDSDRRPHL